MITLERTQTTAGKDSRIHLIIDALQILCLDLPELHLNVRNGVEAFEQRLSRVFLEHLADLMRPLDDDRLNGVHKSSAVNSHNTTLVLANAYS